MTEIILYLILLAAVGLVLGLLIGRYSVKTQIDRQVHAAYLKARDELRSEKQELALSLNQQLFAVRESILKSAEAYESAVRAVEQHLGVNLAGDTARLEGSPPEQLHLEFKTDVRRASDPRTSAPDEEPTIEEEILPVDLGDNPRIVPQAAENENAYADDDTLHPEGTGRAAALVNR